MRERVTPGRALVCGRGAIVAAESPEAGRAAVRALELGGNAVDAAVALGFAACVAQPLATTIAGSGFMLVDDPSRGAWAVEFPPRAPLAARADMYALADDPEAGGLMGLAPVVGERNDVGALAAGVPGVVAGLCEAHERFGVLALSAVIEPAVRLAADGFESSPELQLAALASLPALREDPELSAMLLDEHGVPRVGDFGLSHSGGRAVRLRNPALADVLERIGEGGAAAFYSGQLAQHLVSAVRERGGILSLEDLRAYRPLVGAPLTVSVGEHTLLAPRSPSGGWTSVQALRTWAIAGDGDPGLDAHRRVELMRHAFADRYHLFGDPDMVEVPLSVLLSDEYTAHLAGLVDDGSVRLRFDEGTWQPWNRFARETPHDLAAFGGTMPPVPSGIAPAGQGDSRETTHFSVVDEAGMLVSCTMTAANAWGARVMCHGVLLDDAMIWFNAQPGFPNSIAPGKRPLVNMSPLIARRADGAALAIGAPGGRRLICAVTQTTHRWLAGDRLGAALEAPRFDASGREVLLSPRADDSVRDGLLERGHPIQIVEDRDPFTYEYARPVAVTRGPNNTTREGGVQPYCRGYAAAS